MLKLKSIKIMQSSDDKWSFVENVVYMNLDKRPDRREHMEKMTSCFGNKVHRFSAIEESIGSQGCTKSHIACLQMALDNNWNNVLILEDDAEWTNTNESFECLKSLAGNDYDVIMLSGNKTDCYKHSCKLIKTQTATAYLVNKHYISTVIAEFQEALQDSIQNGPSHNSAHDIRWHGLQSRDNWYITIPYCIYQMPSYSDIEKRNVDYRDDIFSSINFVEDIPKNTNLLGRIPKKLNFLNI